MLGYLMGRCGNGTIESPKGVGPGPVSVKDLGEAHKAFEATSCTVIFGTLYNPARVSLGNLTRRDAE